MQMLFGSSVGKKIAMAATGLILVLFVIVHLIGNTSIFAGPDGINAYAAALHSMGPIVWLFRLVMLAVFLLHIWLGLKLTLENKLARPVGYAQKQNIRTSYAAQIMIYSGLVLLLFTIYHLLHFTVRVTNPEISHFVDAAGRLDVYAMVVLSFQKFFITLTYVIAMVFLLLHLSHGIGSMFQSSGLNNARTLPTIQAAGKWIAIVLLVGYIAIPISIFVGIVKL
ncbi:succinate dehydrogenase cytochrome b subunit [Geoalkalibacter halelectricus]|uniref:Succinate dehydrogenase cytochrome b subunit n=1 Tax=Geoalkalibacter halelectricus TaxID=2847045 RepID=A0ABY5ZTF1_9BACT|nr:succinate dehydrogenase cytochrome b subunit [Geoalkalibacter halelectricus]MDO3376916.1 succinate dehydrogenase cytochrome b subunit [Geoalkalibacter halelectricus]UWZ81140.1 succinate dehydrogenase cytochrome b subunit [Geoalkalibacter halelectricus]